MAVTVRAVTGSRTAGRDTAKMPTSATAAVPRANRVFGTETSHTMTAAATASMTGRAVDTTPNSPCHSCATHRMSRSGGSASRTSCAPATDESCATAAAVPASTEATAADGTATRLAGTDDSGTAPWVASSTGATATCAPIVTAAASRSRPGTYRSRRLTSGAITRTPAVATADNTSPSDAARNGSSRIRRRTVAANDRTGSARTPRLAAIRTTAAITEARMTLGSKRVSTANHATAVAISRRRPRAPTPKMDATSTVPAATTATFEPLTATRCVRPVSRIACS